MMEGMPTPRPRQIRQSAKLLNVRYDVRGPIPVSYTHLTLPTIYSV